VINVSVTFTIHNSDVAQPHRVCPSLLGAADEQQFIDHGYVVIDTALGEAHLAQLRDAVDELAAARFPSPQQRTYDTEFAGQYLRDPHKQDPRIITVALQEVPLADTVRCLLGPRVVLRNSNVRITQPGSADATVWHTDYRPHTRPPSRLPSAPTVITVLIYLDPADAQTGPLLVVPGTHLRPEQPPPHQENLPGQDEVHVQPGQVVLMNAALWHRGGPNVSDRQVRRLLTLQLSTIFMTAFNFEVSLPSPAYQLLLEQARARGDEPLLELLGLGGVNPASGHY
jgi:ectoine hydroxylase-related dioxygenase (phytanoyl-CoA dioxygenase family)